MQPFHLVAFLCQDFGPVLCSTRQATILEPSCGDDRLCFRISWAVPTWFHMQVEKEEEQPATPLLRTEGHAADMDTASPFYGVLQNTGEWYILRVASTFRLHRHRRIMWIAFSLTCYRDQSPNLWWAMGHCNWVVFLSCFCRFSARS